MSHIPDMRLEAGWITVGWLHPDHTFPQADPAPEFLVKLKDYVSRCSQSIVALGLGYKGGVHECEFCDGAIGTGEFAVPAGDSMFLVPPMIGHYVEVHRYAPPQEFVAAILSSPLPGTREYVEAVTPWLVRQRAAEMIDGVSITLERHVAVVLADYLSSLSASDDFNESVDRADKVALWTVIAALKSVLVEQFDPNYQELLTKARRRVVNYGKDEPDE